VKADTGGGGGLVTLGEPTKFGGFGDSASASAFVRPSIAGQYSQAGRVQQRAKTNQDTTLICKLSSNIQVFAVFDGHGSDGHVIATWLAQEMPQALERALGSGGGNEEDGNGVVASVSKAFLDLDDAAKQALGADMLFVSGSTATVALHKGGALMVAGIGDSRSILGGPSPDSEIRVLTTKHNPADPIERARIESMGGEVKVFPDELPIEETGQGRVFKAGDWSPGLAVARAFGDFACKEVGVIALPDVSTVTTAGKQQVLIIASDGVWDVLDDATALQLCLTYAVSQDSAAAARTLVDTSREIWECMVDGTNFAIDDISAIVVFLP